MKLKTNWHFTKWDGLNILFVIQYIRYFKNFEALQMFFYKFLLKWVKYEENFESTIFFEAQKCYCVFELRLNFFFQMVIFATLFRRCPRLWKSTLKMITLFLRGLTLFNSTLKKTTLFQLCFYISNHEKKRILKMMCNLNPPAIQFPDKFEFVLRKNWGTSY